MYLEEQCECVVEGLRVEVAPARAAEADAQVDEHQEVPVHRHTQRSIARTRLDGTDGMKTA